MNWPGWKRLIWLRYPGRLWHDLLWCVAPAPFRERRTSRLLGMDDDAFWLFVGGLNNSGTTLLKQLLDRHSGVRGLPAEGQVLSRALPKRPRGLPRAWSQNLSRLRWTEDNDPAPAARARYDWSWHFRRRPGIPMVKSPHNSVRLRWLQANFTPCRFLLMVRHPYAVCEGIRRRAGATIETAAWHWRIGNEILLADVGMLERAQLVFYEELCTDPAGTLDRIRGFLDLDEPFSPAAIAGELPVQNMDGRPRKLENLNQRSVERLEPGEIAIINRVAGELMDRFGYKRIGPVPAASPPRTSVPL